MILRKETNLQVINNGDLIWVTLYILNQLSSIYLSIHKGTDFRK